jgi:nitrogen fixation-related uncharacterized protein
MKWLWNLIPIAVVLGLIIALVLLSPAPLYT